MNKQRFFWVAILDNDEAVMEYNADGTENNYIDIPRNRVKLFGLQSNQSNYFIDVNTGQFHLNDYKNNKIIDVRIPVQKRLVQITGPLTSEQKYNFFQLKEGHKDFNAATLQHMGGNSLTKQIMGWKNQKHLGGLGTYYVEANLVIDLAQANTRPQIEIILRMAPNTNPVAGSPYVITI